MEQTTDLFPLYQELLLASFDKILNTLPKKHQQIKELIAKSSEQIKAENSSSMNANKYFIIYKLCMETKSSKLIEIALYYIQKLISHGFMDCNCKDYTYNIHVEDYISPNKEPEKPDKNRKLIDAVVEAICFTQYDKDEAIQLQVMKVLLTIITSSNVEVHDKSVLLIFKTFYAINITSKNTVNQTTARAALDQMISAVYQRMEKHNLGKEEWLNYQAQKQSEKSSLNQLSVLNQSTLDLEISSSKSDGTHSNDQSPLPNLDESASNSEPEKGTSHAEKSTRHSNASAMLTDTAELKPGQIEPKNLNAMIEGYVGKAVQTIVDDVVLYEAKIEKVTKMAEEDPNKDVEKLTEDLKNVQIKSVPMTLNSEESKFLRSIDVRIENESGVKSGLFGWCFVCRNAAELYCKDTRVPICSVECKMKHLDEIDEIQSLQTGSPVESRRVNIYLHDGVQLFKLLCKMSAKEDLQQYGLKSKILILEILRGLLESPGPTFLARKEFAEVAKDYLCESILKNSVSTERLVVNLSLGIFVCLVNHFRHHLKQEIAVFINGVFLKMLESGNSTYHHRLLALQVIHKISQRAINMIEFYVNYDCDVQYMNIVERIMEFLSKIAQGKYSKTEYNQIIQPAQEYNLKTLALDSIISFCKSIVRFTEDVENQNKINKVNAPAVNGNDEGDDNDDSSSQADEEETKNENMDLLEKSKQKKNEMQRAVLKFNIKPKNGLKYLYSLGHLKEDPKEVAIFLMKYHSFINKETLGEYFGEPDQFMISVLENFTDMLNFKKTSIDEGMKIFLSYFDLPGEGQKVDRIVQVYARKYLHDNPTSLYKSSTAAYTLSYLLMMLQTSLHNPQVAANDRMTLAQFVNLARGINDGENLPAEELNAIYARVQRAPLAIPSSEQAKQTLLESTQASLKKKQDLFMRESESMINESKQMIKKGRDTNFIRVQSTEYVKPLFSIMWSPLLAGFSVLLEQNDDSKIIQMCLEGYALSIYIAGRYGLDDERDMFVISLYNFTRLKKGYNPIFKEIKEKHLLALKTLLQIAGNPNNCLRSSWGSIIECMSRIDYFLNLTPSVRRESLSSREAENIENENTIGNLLKASIDPNQLELIFSKTSMFNVDEIVSFITHLCAISEIELKAPNPRTYSLQKIVEVAEYNMDRVKFIWRQIWNLMKDHFSKVGCHEDPAISMFAVDSLKQLALKFLKRGEFVGFDFQKEFLDPFETIFVRLPNEKLEIKVLILSCIDHIISHSLWRLKSGWKTIFDVLGHGIESESAEIVEMSFGIIQKHFSNDIAPLKDNLLDYLHVLLKFINCRVEKISFNSVTLIQQGISSIVKKAQFDAFEANKAEVISQGSELPSPMKLSSPTKTSGGEMSSPKKKKGGEPELVVEQVADAGDKAMTSYYGLTEDSWLSLLGKLATMATDTRPKIANSALQTLYTILKENGGVFTHDFWQIIISGVIKLLFDEVQFAFQGKKHSNKDQTFEFLKQNCKQAYSKMIDIYKTYYAKLKDFMPEFLNILVTPMQNPNESLARISIEAFKSFLTNLSPSFDENDWAKIIEAMEKVLLMTTPKMLVEIANSEALKKAYQEKKLVALKWDVEATVTKCIVQMHMMTVVKEFIDEHFEKLREEDINQLHFILQNSYAFARSLNEHIYVRYCLWKNGFMKESETLPGLLKQEKEASATLTLLSYHQYAAAKEEAKKSEFANKFLDNALTLMKAYSGKFEELLQLIKEEVSAQKHPQKTKQGQPGKVDESETLDTILNKLTSAELARGIINLKSILSSVVIPKLYSLDMDLLKPRAKEIVEQLININGNSIAKASLYLNEEGAAMEQSELISDATDQMIKTMLLRFFEIKQNA